MSQLNSLQSNLVDVFCYAKHLKTDETLETLRRGVSV